MTDLKRHIGRIKNTDQRCIVAFMQIPGKEDHALVIPTESLPPRFEQSLMEIVESQEGQSVQDLGNVLGRRLLSDTGKNVLQTFHESGLLQRHPVDNVIMLPRPNMPFPLRQILEQMGKKIEAVPVDDPATVKYNPYANNQEAAKAENALVIAKNLIFEAEMLEGEARRKREEAYRQAPELRTPTPAPAGSVQPIDPALQQMRENAALIASVQASVQEDANPVRRGPGRPRKSAA
jgi:hypothetical protein